MILDFRNSVPFYSWRSRYFAWFRVIIVFPFRNSEASQWDMYIIRVMNDSLEYIFLVSLNIEKTVLEIPLCGWISLVIERATVQRMLMLKAKSGQKIANLSDDGCRLVLRLGPTSRAYCEAKQSRGSHIPAISGLSSHGDSLLKLGLSGVNGAFPGSLKSSASTHIDLELHQPLVKQQLKAVISWAPNAKQCKVIGCTKGARGSTELCIGHGGGQRCQKPGCSKGAESRTAYCKAHGGGKRCQHLVCTKSAEGKTDYWIAHGGGRRRGHPLGCNKTARGKSGICIRHGGGKRCTVDGCTRSAEGQAALCISHGGGRRCQFEGCSKGAQGSTTFCKAHGGGKRCIFAGCSKGADGSTPLCKGHGGGKRCLLDGGGICPKSVHGRTNFCVAHGGGKRYGGGNRCKVENCGKSTQGSTDFCKAHGGGKRCCWGDGKCDKFARGKSGLCAAHCSLVQGKESKKDSTISSALFHGLVVSAASTVENNITSSGVSILSDCADSLEKPSKRRCIISPQVLVPSSMKSNSCYPEKICIVAGNPEEGSSARKSNLDFLVPEGRVHGGDLMSLLGGNLRDAANMM
ncbi:putative WRKY transcription factor 19 [Drosera capensis]